MTNLFSSRISSCLLTAAVAVPLVSPAAKAGVNGRQLASKSAGNVSAAAKKLNLQPPHSKPYGKTYGEWSAKFWQWEFSLPVTGHPLFSDGPVDCSAGQSGPVWFLGGTLALSDVGNGVVLGQATRSCSIPSGTALFFPLVNSECSEVPGDNLGGTTEADLRDCAKASADLTDPATLRVSVDGAEASGPDLYPSFRVTSPLFTLGPLPADNIFESFGLTAPAGSSWKSVSDGVHVMLQPLSVGMHTVVFHGELHFPEGGKFIQDITYHLNVTPPGHE